jgi:hypothetical protein
MDFVRLRLTYDDWVEDTSPMQRWIAEIFCWLFAGGYEWSEGHTVKRALIIPL